MLIWRTTLLLILLQVWKGADAFCMVTPDADGHAFIPAGTKSIPQEAFAQCTNLSSITIPSSVTTIGHNAFSGCSSLTSITLPSSVTTIGIGAFFQCASLTSITIPSLVTAIGDSAFSGCSSLTSITIPSSVTTIDQFAFAQCTNLASVGIMADTSKINPTMFDGDRALAQVSIPASSSSIGGSARFSSFAGLVCDPKTSCVCAKGFNGDVSASQLTCSACVPGSYKEQSGREGCTGCLPGKFMDVYNTGSTSSSDCKPCPVGTFAFVEGGYICLPCQPGSAAPTVGSSVCPLCARGSYSDKFGSTGCTLCPIGMTAPALGSISCVPDSGTSALVSGLFANQGTPFYVIAIVTCIAVAFGFAINYTKKGTEGLFLPTMVSVAVDFLVFSGGLGSDLVLASGLLQAQALHLQSFGLLILFGRVLAGAFPAVFVFYGVVTGAAEYSALLDTVHLYKNAKVYGLLLLMALFDSKLLLHLPWHGTEFANLSGGFPSLGLLRLSLSGTFVQLIVTFAGQIGLLLHQHYGSSSSASNGDTTLFIVLMLNVGFSSAKLLIAFLEFVLRFNVLSGVQQGKSGKGEARKFVNKGETESEVEMQTNPVAYPSFPQGDVSGQPQRLSLERVASIQQQQQQQQQQRLSFLQHQQQQRQQLSGLQQQQQQQQQQQLQLQQLSFVPQQQRLSIERTNNPQHD